MINDKSLKASIHARILLAEDESILRKMYEISLSRRGYSVVSASNGLEALNLFKRTPDDFDAIITDQMMPIMCGTDFCTQALEIKPQLTVILVTGYSHISEADVKALGVKYLLKKPISFDEVAKIIEDVLKKKFKTIDDLDN